MSQTDRAKVASAAVLAVVISVASVAQSAGIKDVEFFGFGDERGRVPDADAEAGLLSILKGEEFHHGLPVKLYNRSLREQGGFDLETQWRVFGELPAPAWRKTREAPVTLAKSVFEREGVLSVNTNCFTCHAGITAGQVIAGAGSTHFDAVSFGASAAPLLAQWHKPTGRALLRLLLKPAEFRQLKGFIAHTEQIVMPSVQARSRGEIHGPWVIWRMIARMIDPAVSFEMYPLGVKAPLEALLDRQLPPVDPNPWWNIKYKNRAFWLADVSRHSLATFAINLMDDHPDNMATFPDRMERTRKMLAFAAQTQAPKYPRDRIDAERAAHGQKLFHGEIPLADGTKLGCTGCHGTYAADGHLVSYPNRDAVDLRVIGTDPAYASILYGELKPLYDHFDRSPYVLRGPQGAHYPDTRGYVPPPLVGIWASSPYFHNGSVPTVMNVLDSTSRPALWLKSIDPFAYDWTRIGQLAQPINAQEYQGLENAARGADLLSPMALELRKVYDTRVYGRTNGGHTFGDRMTYDERLAVVEYLKLL